MKWLELSIRAPSEMVEPLSALFYRHGYGGVVAEEAGGFNPDNDEPRPANRESIVKTYLPIDRTTRSRKEGIEIGLRLFALLCPLPSLVETEIDEVDWAESWKAHFPILHVGRRIVVKPAWHEYAPQGEEVVVHIDPGMAFGTGHHPTTRLCLEALEQFLVPGDEVFDFGTGSAVLSIAAMRLGAKKVVGLEVDALAVKAARTNVADNGLTGGVAIYEGSLPNSKVSKASVDLALANLSTKILRDQAKNMAWVIRPGALLVASGFTLDQERRTLDALEAASFILTERVQEEDWVCVVMKRQVARD